MKKRNVAKLLAMAVMLVCLTQTSMATPVPIAVGDRILFDYGAIYTGTTDGLGRTWNSGLTPTAGTTFSNLYNTAGVQTDVDIWWSWATTGWSSGDSSLTASNLTDYPDFAFKDRYGNDPTHPGTCVLQGLNKNLTYDITIYGSRGVTANDRIMQVTIGGVSQSYNGGGTAGEGLVTFTGLSPSVTGEITIDFACTANYGYLSVIDVTVVPEPAMMSLLGLGGLALLARRRK